MKPPSKRWSKLWPTRARRRAAIRNRLLLSVVLGTAVAVAARSIQARRVAQGQVPPVPAPSREWPPLPDLAATTSTATPATATPDPPAAGPVPSAGPSSDPTPTTSPVSAVVVTPDVRVETSSPAPADEVDVPPEVAPAPAIRVPGDGPGGAVGTIVTEDGPDSGEGRDDGARDAAEEADLVTDPQPEAVLPDERIDRAREEQPLIADGTDDVPPAPEPTFGTVPDPEAAAEAPVPVATPVETGPEEELSIPHRGPVGAAAGESRTQPPGPERAAEPPAAEPAPPPKAKRGSSSGKGSSSKAARADSRADRAALTPWVVPSGGGCPGSHPVKAELSQGRFHLPGGAAYDAADADRCYLDAGAAEADGLRPADG